jgi:leader peptidase (prepilin peptidase)/N-methyltransferase
MNAPLALWVQVLAGVLLGYLVGGAVVWLVRIFGSLAFGKEAMGMGDVHLMAAVGACLGWVDSTIAFFGAAFVGLAWTLLGALFSGKVTRQMPYGPYLAAATLLVLVFKPLICRWLAVLGIPIC